MIVKKKHWERVLKPPHVYHYKKVSAEVIIPVLDNLISLAKVCYYVKNLKPKPVG